MFTSREAIFEALFNLLCGTKPPSYLGGTWNYQSRDLLPWEMVEVANQPALFVFQTPQHATMDTFGLTQWKLGAAAMVYYRRDEISDPSVPWDEAVNDTLDILESAINPFPGQTQTLGGLVLHTYIDGAVVFDSGRLDPQAFILVPITMVLGAFGA